MLAPTSFFGDYGCHVRIVEEARYLQQNGQQVTICTYQNGRDLPDLDIRRTISLPWRGDYEV
ncbi:MAG: glycosyltransferase family 1 protein, partial [Chloroflexi bacterium]|nr:glycosyltransferase family 1 protein [Chloroflexota bacterium]